MNQYFPDAIPVTYQTTFVNDVGHSLKFQAFTFGHSVVGDGGTRSENPVERYLHSSKQVVREKKYTDHGEKVQIQIPSDNSTMSSESEDTLIEEGEIHESERVVGRSYSGDDSAVHVVRERIRD